MDDSPVWQKYNLPAPTQQMQESPESRPQQPNQQPLTTGNDPNKLLNVLQNASKELGWNKVSNVIGNSRSLMGGDFSALHPSVQPSVPPPTDSARPQGNTDTSGGLKVPSVAPADNQGVLSSYTIPIQDATQSISDIGGPGAGMMAYGTANASPAGSTLPPATQAPPSVANNAIGAGSGMGTGDATGGGNAVGAGLPASATGAAGGGDAAGAEGGAGLSSLSDLFSMFA